MLGSSKRVPSNKDQTFQSWQLPHFQQSQGYSSLHYTTAHTPQTMLGNLSHPTPAGWVRGAVQPRGGGAWSLFAGSMPLGGPSLSPLPWSSCPSLVLNVSMFLPPAPCVQHVVKTTAGGVDGVDEIVMTVDFFGGWGDCDPFQSCLRPLVTGTVSLCSVGSVSVA